MIQLTMQNWHIQVVRCSLLSVPRVEVPFFPHIYFYYYLQNTALLLSVNDIIMLGTNVDKI